MENLRLITQPSIDGSVSPKRLRWYWKPGLGYSWRVDETYVKVKGNGLIFIVLLIREDGR